MNNNAAQKVSLWQQFRPFWQVSLQASREYKMVTLVTFVLAFAVYYSVMQAMFVDSSFRTQLAVLLRGVLDTTTLILCCHFLLRPYLKLTFIPQGRFGWELVQLVVWLYVLGVLSMLLSYGYGKIPLLKLTDFSSMVFTSAEGEHQMRLDTGTTLLIGGFNQAVVFATWAMAYVMWQSIKSKKQMQIQMQQTQLQQLTNQLSPHFLFNAFNSIRALIYEDRDKAAETVTQLSELFRTHLQAHLRPLSSLAEEWQIAQRYLAIEQVRLEQRLQVQLDFAEQLWQQQIPTLSLLTLVENAVKHGISPNQQPGVLRISSLQLSASRWRLEVQNSYRHQSQQAGTQTGLANLRQRLVLMPGENTLTTNITEPKQGLGQFLVTLELQYD
ncbi:sensor histidine kinase [Rheinheimera riviphila]|nr:histidine kinase [Rheinheimera riviphila]